MDRKSHHNQVPIFESTGMVGVGLIGWAVIFLLLLMLFKLETQVIIGVFLFVALLIGVTLLIFIYRHNLKEHEMHYSSQYNLNGYQFQVKNRYFKDLDVMEIAFVKYLMQKKIFVEIDNRSSLFERILDNRVLIAFVWQAEVIGCEACIALIVDYENQLCYMCPPDDSPDSKVCDYMRDIADLLLSQQPAYPVSRDTLVISPANYNGYY